MINIEEFKTILDRYRTEIIESGEIISRQLNTVDELYAAAREDPQQTKLIDIIKVQHKAHLVTIGQAQDLAKIVDLFLSSAEVDE